MSYQLTGPQGGGEPVSLKKYEQTPPGIFPLPRPMVRRRCNAAEGRPVMPADNAAESGDGDYPLWLYEAQSCERFYCDFDRQNNRQAGENSACLTLVFSRFHNGLYRIREDAAWQEDSICSALFVDWCLARSVNRKTGNIYAHFGKKAAFIENWQHYGVATQPCLGAVMIAEEAGQFCLAFCVGAVKLQYGSARDEMVYLGLGVKPDGIYESKQIGLLVFAASAVTDFRLPPYYSPCKEHFKLEYTAWAEQFKEMIALSAKQCRREQADNNIVVAGGQKAQSLLLPGKAAANFARQKMAPVRPSLALGQTMQHNIAEP